MSLQTLDPKCSIDILYELGVSDFHIAGNAECKSYAGGAIWVIDEVLSPFECQNILSSCENSYEYLQYRNSWRTLAIDQNKVLTNLLQDRLKQNNFLDKLNDPITWQHPRGFHDPNIRWLPNDGTINSCIRINKYVNSDFKWHRDASLTLGDQLKSNYTVIAYLNDGFVGGETEFMLPTIDYEDSGLTIQDELNLIGELYNIIKIKPKIGRVVIFDHGLIHRSSHTKDTKYVLRTDLICKGYIELPEMFKKSQTQKDLENITKCLFRQAQLNELDGLPCNDLYEICLSLRQDPDFLTSVPDHLYSLITNTNIKKVITSNLVMLSRSGSSYTFSYNTLHQNKFELLKTATLFALETLTNNITDEIVKKFNDKLFGTRILVNKYYNPDMTDTEHGLKLKEIKERLVSSAKQYMSKSTLKKIKKINARFDAYENNCSINNYTYFSDSIGKYNLAEDIPDKFIDALASVVRIRAQTVSRTTFDLTNTVIIDDIKIKRMIQSKALFTLPDGTKITELPLNYFKIDFNSSLHETLNRLFKQLDYPFNSQSVKQLEFDKLEQLTNGLPIHTIIKLLGKRYDIKILTETHDPYDRIYETRTDIDIRNSFCFHAFKFTTQIGNHQMNFRDVQFENDGLISGIITCDAPSCYFNHAACRSSYVSKNERNVKKVSDQVEVQYTILTYKINFTLDSCSIKLDIVPNVVL
jgi:hypothetical protein